MPEETCALVVKAFLLLCLFSGSNELKITIEDILCSIFLISVPLIFDPNLSSRLCPSNCRDTSHIPSLLQHGLIPFPENVFIKISL